MAAMGKKKGAPVKKQDVSVKKTPAKKTAASKQKQRLKKNPDNQPKKPAKTKSNPVKVKKTTALGKKKNKTSASSKPETAPPDIKQIRKDLLLKKTAILKEAKQEIAKYISGDTRQLVDTAIDDGDWAVVDISEEISLRMLTNHRKRLREIDDALRKIDQGSYGICEECSEEISEKRLKIMPAANLCIDCQENKEKLEAVEASD